MRIETLELSNFRNYESLSVSFDEGVNIIYGANAQGKTNILESIYMCSCGKSHKGSKEKDIIKDDEKEGHIKGEFAGTYGKERVDIHLKAGGSKGIAVNRVPIKRISELYGRIKVVIFSAEDLEIIRRGPSARRKFMDMELCQLDRLYVEDLITYNKLRLQRSEIFKSLEESENKKDELLDTLDILDFQLVKAGTGIIRRRRKFIEEINNIILDIHYSISAGEEKIRIVYEPSVREETFYEELRKSRQKDIITKATNVGPHRDDFSFFVKGRDMKVFGSNGQQRTCALSLKLSEIKMIEQIKKEKPVLLLDDVLSELDRNRQRQLLKSLGQTQTIITCTGVDEFIESELKEAKKFLVNKGKIE